ncbi:kptA, partial [Symbiodinium necroappetens]
VAFLGSAAQLQRGLGTQSPSEASDGFFGPKRWRIRSLAIAGTWMALLAYSVLLAPGKSPDERVADQALIQQIFSTPFDGSVNPLFCCIFNMLGIWPMIYAATLLPGADRQSPAPALPFVAGSFFLGAFALSPYLALRENRSVAGQSGEIDWATANILENRLTALVLLAFAAYLALFAVGNGVIGGFSPSEAFSGFMPVFGSSLTAHVSSLDFMVLWMLFGPVLLEDGRRRGNVKWPGLAAESPAAAQPAVLREDMIVEVAAIGVDDEAPAIRRPQRRGDTDLGDQGIEARVSGAVMVHEAFTLRRSLSRQSAAQASWEPSSGPGGRGGGVGSGAAEFVLTEGSWNGRGRAQLQLKTLYDAVHVFILKPLQKAIGAIAQLHAQLLEDRREALPDLFRPLDAEAVASAALWPTVREHCSAAVRLALLESLLEAGRQVPLHQALSQPQHVYTVRQRLRQVTMQHIDDTFLPVLSMAGIPTTDVARFSGLRRRLCIWMLHDVARQWPALFYWKCVMEGFIESRRFVKMTPRFRTQFRKTRQTCRRQIRKATRDRFRKQ